MRTVKGAAMTSTITARVDVDKRTGLRLGLADGKYGLAPDFDKKFDAMDAEIAEQFA